MKTLAKFSPFEIAIDTREQLPYDFTRVSADKAEGGGVILVRRDFKTLKTGDYSITGHEADVAIERKSKEDLYHTIGQERARFERELIRLNDMKLARVLVEAEMGEIATDPPAYSMLPPKCVVRSIIAWQQRFTNIHWLFVPGREFAASLVYRIFDRYVKDIEQADKDRAKAIRQAYNPSKN
jgi:hypothetical protein